LPLVYKIRLDYWFVEKVSTWQVSRSAVMARHGSMAAGMMVPRLVLALLLPVAVTALDNGLAITREAMSSPVRALAVCCMCCFVCFAGRLRPCHPPRWPSDCKIQPGPALLGQ
jgi:hypothetical protein